MNFFFVDDIAHQTGHVILTATTANRKGSFIIDETLQLSILLNDVTEYRSFYTLFHALYTYHSITLCLDKILKSKVLSIAMEKEAIGRIGFYMLKFEADLQQFNKVIMHFTSIEFALTFLGIEIFQLIEKQHDYMFMEWNPVVEEFNYQKQAYNYSHKVFLIDNTSYYA